MGAVYRYLTQSKVCCLTGYGEETRSPHEISIATRNFAWRQRMPLPGKVLKFTRPQSLSTSKLLKDSVPPRHFSRGAKRLGAVQKIPRGLDSAMLGPGRADSYQRLVCGRASDNEGHFSHRGTRLGLGSEMDRFRGMPPVQPWP
jgi:hypothetical protein